jgi:formylglycine-generating enzyme required for sulfatase activity
VALGLDRAALVAVNIWPYVLTADAERTLKPDANNSFRECAPTQENKDYCPDMIVVPAGSFLMGSPLDENGRGNDEGPQHLVTFANPFAISKFDVTFDEWDTCATYGDCDPRISDSGFGRGRQPVINVSWDDAQQYVSWLSRMTGKSYRLLSEAEYEYAGRAGALTAYPWGDDISENNANCNGCGSRSDNRQPAPIGSFAPNKFGLYDVVGNVWKWVEDCYHDSYTGAPIDGSAWLTACPDVNRRILRAGGWGYAPSAVRLAKRGKAPGGGRNIDIGIRVAKTLAH